MSKGLYDIETLIEGLRQQRDQLKVQLHLAQAEAKEEWDEAEKKLQHLTAKLDQVGKETGKASEEVFEAAKLVAEEIKRGYERVRKLL